MAPLLGDCDSAPSCWTADSKRALSHRLAWHGPYRGSPRYRSPRCRFARRDVVISSLPAPPLSPCSSVYHQSQHSAPPACLLVRERRSRARGQRLHQRRDRIAWRSSASRWRRRRAYCSDSSRAAARLAMESTSPLGIARRDPVLLGSPAEPGRARRRAPCRLLFALANEKSSNLRRLKSVTARPPRCRSSRVRRGHAIALLVLMRGHDDAASACSQRQRLRGSLIASALAAAISPIGQCGKPAGSITPMRSWPQSFT